MTSDVTKNPKFTCISFLFLFFTDILVIIWQCMYFCWNMHAALLTVNGKWGSTNEGLQQDWEPLKCLEMRDELLHLLGCFHSRPLWREYTLYHEEDERILLSLLHYSIITSHPPPSDFDAAIQISKISFIRILLEIYHSPRFYSPSLLVSSHIVAVILCIIMYATFHVTVLLCFS